MNLQREERNGVEITPQMKQVWSIQLDLLKKLLEVCEKHNLKIWAFAGTLIGAIRHNGYIPWDDDIDMIMMRDDYDKLITVANQEFAHPYFLQNASNDIAYFRGHAQLRNSDTTAILPGDIWQEFNQGIFVDIFVMDYIPEDEEARAKIFSKMENIRHRLCNRAYGTFLTRKPWKTLSTFLYYNNHPFYNDFKKMESLIVNCDNKSSHCIAPVMFTIKDLNRMVSDIEYYKETIYHKFEDIQIPIPVDYDRILKSMYGDYMKPSKAPSMHGSVIFDTERSYIEVLKELRKEASFKQKLQHFFMPPHAKN